jgi:NMD protein affecting ribosome stability and mRNA decay
MTFSSEFYLEYCCNCGIAFAMPTSFCNERRRDLKLFYCPNGHSQLYTKSTEQELKEEKEAMERSLQAQLNNANHRALVAEKAAKQAIKDKRRVERRIAHGVCPCCNKTFADIANHMITEHKDFRLPQGKEVKAIEGSVQ